MDRCRRLGRLQNGSCEAMINIRLSSQEACEVANALSSTEACAREIADLEARCDLVCDMLAPGCNDCAVPSVIAIIKRRRRELIDQEGSG